MAYRPRPRQKPRSSQRSRLRPTHGCPAGYPQESLFGGPGTLIEGRVVTQWGAFSLVEATRELLRAAAADPTNQR